jgi:hypothetical protein
MERTMKILGVACILVAAYVGVRYVSATINYACSVPEEDCPPPFFGLAKIGFYATGGELVPFWTREDDTLR